MSQMFTATASPEFAKVAGLRADGSTVDLSVRPDAEAAANLFD
jgi:hypothetical protein